MDKVKCPRCSYEWTPIKPDGKPTQCPQCHAPLVRHWKKLEEENK